MQIWLTLPFLKALELVYFLLPFFYCQKPAHPCLVPLPGTGSEHSCSSSSNKPPFSLLSSLGPTQWTERSFEDVA